MNSLIDSILLIPGIIIALVFHEFSHGLAADKLGDPTPRSYGRLTIEPWPHLDIIGLILIFFPPHFGWAKPIPIDPRNFKKPRRDEIIVSFAGPLANFVIAVFFGFILMLIQNFSILSSSVSAQAILVKIVALTIVINVNLFLFNLLPIPPLDGSHILANILPYKYSQKYLELERYGVIILLVLALTGIFGLILSGPAQMIYYLILKIFGLV
ncbi:MAG: site-2 protease family protein [Ignavibacteriales bacterium]